MAILVWAPLPFASNRLWSGALLCMLIFVVLSLWLLLFLAGRVRLHAAIWQRGKWTLLLLSIVQLWVFIQLLPLPRPLVELLSPQAFQWHIGEGWLSLSLDREYGKYYLLRGCAFTAGFFLTLALINSPGRLKTVLTVLLFSGTFQAAYGAFMVLSGLELGFFVEKYTGVGVATGTFVNRNHLAGYLVMCLSAGIGLMLSQPRYDWPEGSRARLRRVLEFFLDEKLRVRVCLAVMVIALVLTRARMGNVAFFMAMGLAGALSLSAQRQFTRRLVVLLGSLVVVDTLIIGRWFGLDRLLGRWQAGSLTEEGRVWSSQYALEYLQHFPLTGSGGGSFYGVFPNFQGTRLQHFHAHAHNDYLEFGVELGVPALVILLLAVARTFRCAYWVQRNRQTPLFRGASFAVLMTILWAAIHSQTDFNLQIPANALTFVTILGLAFVCRGLPGGKAASAALDGDVE